LRGFSSGNLKKMRVFADFWMEHLKIGSAMPNQMENDPNTIGSILSNQLKNTTTVIGSIALNQLPDNFANLFFSVGFSHHYTIASKCNTFDDAWFYLQKTTTELWKHSLLVKQLKANLFKQQGTLPNNFNATLPESHKEK